MPLEDITTIRKIIHVDMDAFYASVEQKDDLNLRGKPIAVGGNKERGVVAAASYEARKYGVKSAMPSSIAARRCPNLIFIKPRFDRYREISQQIREVFFEYTDLVEPLSLDEAYLDVTVNKIGLNSATIIAREIRQKIKERTDLTSSAGISYCKFLAKTASDVNKPNGIFTILPQDAEAYLHKMPIHKFHGIGHATAEKMKLAGIFTGADLKKKTLDDLKRRYGKIGSYYYNICRGIDNRPVVPDRERKSISAERTFDHHMMKLNDITSELKRIAEITYDRYQKHENKGRTVIIKVKYGDFKQVTRSHSSENTIMSLEDLFSAIDSIIDSTLIREEGVRLLGVGISNFQKKEPPSELNQLTLKF